MVLSALVEKLADTGDVKFDYLFNQIHTQTIYSQKLSMV